MDQQIQFFSWLRKSVKYSDVLLNTSSVPLSPPVMFHACLCDQLTPWSRYRLKNLLAHHPDMKFPARYGSGKGTNAFTKSCLLSPFRAMLIHSTLTHRTS
jgi:hypothetical protein